MTIPVLLKQTLALSFGLIVVESRNIPKILENPCSQDSSSVLMLTKSIRRGRVRVFTHRTSSPGFTIRSAGSGPSARPNSTDRLALVPRTAYLGAMGRYRDFFRLINPLVAARDFRNELAVPRPHRWPLMGVAAASTFAVFSVMLQEGSVGMPLPPKIL